MKFSDISKRIGWEHPPIPVPQRGTVAACVDLEQLLKWNRFCVSPRTEEEIHTVNLIVSRLGKLRQEAA